MDVVYFTSSSRKVVVIIQTRVRTHCPHAQRLILIPHSGSLELIANGTIKVRQCSQGIKKLTPKSIILQDGREVETDAIVLATGYAPLEDTLRKIVGDEVADQCKVGIYFNEDKEIAGVSLTGC